jgi:dihydroxy-acid dehydratase
MGPADNGDRGVPADCRDREAPDSPPRGDELSPRFLLGFRRALYRGAGFSRAEVRRPLVGVASSWGEINPASRHLGELTRRVKLGVRAAGATPVEFVLSGLCDGTCAAAPMVNRYNLPWRDIAVAYLEAVVTANMFDAVVFVGVCDEVVPAHLMAAVRLDLPALLVLGGSMPQGCVADPRTGARPAWAGDMTGAYADLTAGALTEEQYRACEDGCCTGAGACGVMGTANTMQIFAEASGLALPGNAVAPGESRELEDLAFRAGARVVGLMEEDLRPSGILTRGALENAVRTVVTVGGSTCAVLHAQAVAAEAGLSLELEDFDRLSRSTPLLVDVQPGGTYPVEEYHLAGGVQATLRALAPLLDLDVFTVTGKRLGVQLAEPAATEQVQEESRGHPGAFSGGRGVIRPLERPLQPEGAIAVLKGSLAPAGAVFKQSASGARAFRGPARVFETEEEAGDAIMDGTVTGGEVLVVRGNGPKGAPGMPCLYGSLWLLKSKGLDDRVALVTDGRLSGTIRGMAVAHVSPEAGEGGAISLVQDGDLIEIDVAARRLDLLVDPSELSRRPAWRPAASGVPLRGALAEYEALVGPTHEGAILGALARDAGAPNHTLPNHTLPNHTLLDHTSRENRG